MESLLQKKGFTLVELMVSTALFALIVLAATSGLVASIARERSVRADVAMQRSMYTFLDELEYEVHLARRVGCGSIEANCPNGGGVLELENATNEIIRYQASGGEVIRSEGAGSSVTALTGGFGSITSLTFYIRAAVAGLVDPENRQYALIITIEGESSTGKIIHGYRYITPYALDVND